MKCTIPEISWHNRDPVLSIDLQVGKHRNSGNQSFWRLATGGNDSHVLIWHLLENKIGAVTCVADLERHQKAVNIVRFSPSGNLLASGDDDSIIIVWKQREEFEGPLFPEENSNSEQWQSLKVLRGHVEDVSDLSWSPDSTSLISGSVDNSVIVWDVKKGRKKQIFSDYKGFVQGVAWDPRNQYACTISSDRHCRLIQLSSMKTVQRVLKSKIPTPADHPLKDKMVRLFHDDTFKSFYRRLSYTPDGSLIIVPSGIIEPHNSNERLSNATIVFSRHSIKAPVMILPSLKENTIAVRCCPKYFKLRKDGPPAIVVLPYRMVFAVATNKSVLIYDTQQTTPIAMISNIHYTRLTDITWSSDGSILMVSSTDGYCSIIYFNEGELGETYEVSQPKTTTVVTEETEHLKNELNASKDCFIEPDCDAMDIDITKCVSSNVDIMKLQPAVKISPKKILDEKLQTNERGTEELKEDTCDIKLVYEDSTTCMDVDKNSAKITPPKNEPLSVISNKTPRRVQLITLSSPKHAKKDRKT